MAFLQCWKEWVEFWKRPTSIESAGRKEAQEWVNDGSIDLKGRRVLRENTGGWKASFFIIGVEFSERLTYYGIASNLIIYLTTVLHEGVAKSAKNVNYWLGVTTVVPLAGGFLADSCCGRYWVVLISSVIYLLGLIMLTLSVSISALKPPQCEKNGLMCSEATSTQVGIFFLALYLISLGTGGHKPSLQAFGADQFNEEDRNEKIKKTSFFNWWYFGLCGGTLLGVTVVVYVEDHISWGLGFGIPTVAMGIAIALFLYGTPFYRQKIPAGSPITRMGQVVVAAIRNRNLDLPSDWRLLYENSDVESRKCSQRHLSHTENFVSLDKAAIVHAGGNEAGITHRPVNPWKLCTVTQVEETKLILRMVPIWLACLIFGVSVSQGATFFIKQGSTMDRRMGPHSQIPPGSLLSFSALSTITFVPIYDRLLVPMAKRITGKERGISILQRIGLGMFLSIISMITAAVTETKRKHVAERHGLLDDPRATVPLSVFWLVPQFVLLGIADVFTLVGLQEYFYDEVPDGMRSLGIAFYLSVMGVANFVSNFLITIAEKVSKRGGHHGWFVNNLNRCHLDYFYWLVAVLSCINLCFYVYVAHKYTYKKMKQMVAVTDSYPVQT